MNDLISKARFSIWNPFNRFAGWQAIVSGIIVLLLTALFSWQSSVHKDGLIDMHYLGENCFVFFLLEAFIVLLSAIIIFYLLALIFGARSFRFIDLAGTLSLAQLPMMLAILSAWIFGPTQVLEYIESRFLGGEAVELTSIDVLLFSVSIIIQLYMIVWTIVLMLNAYKVSTGLSKARLIVSFILGFILVEAAVKILFTTVLDLKIL